MKIKIQKLKAGVALLILTAAASGAAQETVSADEPVVLEEYFVTASRSVQPLDEVPHMVDTFSADQLRYAPALTLDDALASSPAFSLFRRTSSLMAHPTAQGVSLRGIGPSGASRTLVLLDGVPLNDPFGGWVAWSKIPRLSLTHAEIVRGGGSGSWGSAALGGVIQLFTRGGQTTRHEVTAGAGTNSTYSGAWHSRVRAGDRTFAGAGARWFSTDGFFQFASRDRGLVDRRFDSEHRLVHADIDHELANGIRFGVGGRWFDEERGNGTPYQINDSREQEVRAHAGGTLGDGGEFDSVIYVQNQSYAARFSSVDDTRSSETPALDQFEVPATSYGAALVTRWDHGDTSATTVGADFRHTNGETREAYLFNDGAFQRNRFAGGTQLIGGVFATHHRELTPALRAQLSARLDHWRISNGHRRDINVATGATTVDESHPDRDGTVLSPSLGVVWTAAEGMLVRASVYRAFRLPTLNEFYRPFRVGNVTTLANPALDPETLDGVDASIATEWGNWDLSLGGFFNRFNDAVSNITLSTSPEGTTRQRRNLDEVHVRGLEARIATVVSDAISASVSYLLSDTSVRESPDASDLLGNRLPQVPTHTVTFAAQWFTTDAIRIDLVARAVSSQYEDDANELELDSAVTFDVRANYALTGNVDLWVTAENLFDARVETSTNASGLTSLAPGRFVRAGLNLEW